MTDFDDTPAAPTADDLTKADSESLKDRYKHQLDAWVQGLEDKATAEAARRVAAATLEATKLALDATIAAAGRLAR